MATNVRIKSSAIRGGRKRQKLRSETIHHARRSRIPKGYELPCSKQSEVRHSFGPKGGKLPHPEPRPNPKPGSGSNSDPDSNK